MLRGHPSKNGTIELTSEGVVRSTRAGSTDDGILRTAAVDARRPVIGPTRELA
jgi:hypothetical protein